VFFLLVIIVFAASYYYFKSMKKLLILESENNLSITAELKANEITNWRQERVDDALTLAPYYIDAAKIKILKEIGDGIKRQELFCKWTRDIQKNPEYEGIYLYDLSLKLIAFGCTGNESVPLGNYETAQALKAIQSKKMIFSDLYRNESNRSIDLDIYVPVFETSLEDTKVAGLIALKINPDKFLYPLLRVNPGLSNTFETYMVRVREDKIQYLNELKYSTSSALSMATPSANESYLDPTNIEGIKGAGEGMDYRGIPVLYSIRGIPETPWLLVDKIDKEEVHAPVKQRALFVILFASIFVVGLGAWLGFMWYGQLVGFYKNQYTYEVERKTMTKKYDYLIKFANDIIIMLNKDLRIVEANDKALRAYKYAPNEIVEKSFNDLLTADSIAGFKGALEVVEKKGSNIFQTLHKRKDGSTFAVEVSMQHFVIEWIEYYQAIIRDISERKA
jgi:PAS domain S-box-containing protein